MKKFFFVIVFLLISVNVNGEGSNLIKNGDFESSLDQITPFDWNEQAFLPEKKISLTTDIFYMGKRAVEIKNIKDNDVRLTQIVQVDSNSSYCFSGWIKTENVTGNQSGANLSIVTSSDCSESITGTTDWKLVKYYFKTNSNQDSIMIGVRLGNWGKLVRGTAFFDDLKLEKVNALPSMVQVLTDNKKILYQKKGWPEFELFMIWGIIIIPILTIVWILFKRRNSSKK